MSDILTGIPGVVVGRVAGPAPDGRPLVEWGGQVHEARAVWLPVTPDWGDMEGARVVLGFEEGDVAKPLVLGLLDAPAIPAPPPAPAPMPDPAPASEMAAADPEGVPRSVRIEGEEEVVLECGKAKVILRADGRIVIRGGYLVSRSTGPVKIKGASVAIN